jgi:tRNA (guanine37-N1)-methyltransferase
LVYDIIGTIAIYDPKENKEDEKKLVKKILEVHKNVKTILRKESGREGEFRLRKLKLVAGENKSVTIHKENNCIFKLNVRKVYFSPREGTERMIVAEKINEYMKNFGISGDLVLVFFAGIGPYAILISKRCFVKNIIAIEKNPVAVKYLKENIKLNKIKNVQTICDDVRDAAKKFFNQADFVIMPLPESGWNYLEYAINCLKNKGICFFYGISEEKNLFDKWKEIIRSTGENLNRDIKFLNERKVLPFGIRKFKVRIDFMVF